MATFTLGSRDGLYFNHHQPSGVEKITFVFFNALTGNTDSWEASIGPDLRAAGHGTLTWNFRGQPNSPFSDPASITASAVVDDAVRLLRAEAPTRPVYVGLSIGGLFAAQTHIGGTVCEGLLLINTLRKPGPRLSWTNRATHRTALLGGGRLIQDLMLQHLTGPAWLAANSANFLKDEPYEPLDPDSGTARLLAAGIDADWAIAYERLTMPVTILSGLRDHIFYEAADVAELTKRIPNAETIDISDIGHLVTMERPAAITRACLALADRLG